MIAPDRGARALDMNATRHSRWLSPLLLAWVALLAIETLGQVSLRHAGMDVGEFELTRPSILRALTTPWLWVGIGCYLGQFAVWMNILEKSTLSSAFPTSAIVFVAIMAASWAVFDDPMGWDKLLGSAIIVAGILLLGGDAQPAPPAPPRNDVEGNPS